MQIVFHLGAHCTAQDQMFRCLIANREVLSGQEIYVPDPEKYRHLLRDTAANLRGRTASLDDERAVLRHIIGDQPEPKRLILGWENFMSFPQWAFRQRLYPTAAERVRAFTQIFPSHDSVFHLALRNVASLLPGLHERATVKKTWAEFTRKTTPLTLRWSGVIEDIIMQSPNVPLTVWRDEDSPYVWHRLLIALAGCTPDTPLQHADSFPLSLMHKDGIAALLAYIQAHNINDPADRRALIPQFIAQYPQPETLEQDIDVPDWTQDTLDTFEGMYEEDVAAIKGLSGLTFIE